LGYPRSGLERSDFVLWHKCEVPTASSNVRYREQPGKHMLALSFSGFDLISDISGCPETVARRGQAPAGIDHVGVMD
jgi:hypothetical protein